MSLAQIPEGIDVTITPAIISDLIRDHKTAHDRMIEQYNRYTGNELPINKRTFTDTTKVNRKLANDYRGEIVDQLVGFLFGKPITYVLDETVSDTDRKYFTNFMRYNIFDNLDLETGRRSSICGTCPRILYVDKQGKEKIMYCPPWEVIFVYSASLQEPQYALRYYTVVDTVKNTTITKVEWYDKTSITFYTNSGSGQYVLDLSVPVNPMPHLFTGIPVIEFESNDERQSDFYKTTSLIDSYDRTLSDVQNEIEEFRNAYLIFTGCKISKEDVIAARQVGSFTGLDADANIKFLTKDINDTFFENHKKTLRENIYRFSKTVDISSDTFSGSGASGETRKWLLVALEMRAAIRQMKFSKSLYNQFKILASLWAKKGVSITENEINYEYDRLYPQELKLEAEILGLLDGKVSKKTQLSVFSPVRDVDKEIENIAAEKEAEPAPTTLSVNENEEEEEN